MMEKEGGMDLEKSFATERFTFSYSESDVDSRVLWESHCHAAYEMIAVLEGDVSIVSEGVRYRLTEGQAVILPPLSYHAVRANKKGFYRRVTVFFELSAVPAVLKEELSARGAGLRSFSFAASEGLGQIFAAADTSRYAPLAESYMTQLLYRYADAPEAGQTVTDALVSHVVSYVDAHLGERILLSDLARHTARSVSSLCHLFEEKMGIPPKKYVLEKKLAYASKLIREGTPPTVAAARVGYENYSAFYRVYRKQMGYSPAKEHKE